MKKLVSSAIVLTSLGMLASCKGGTSDSQTATPAATVATPIPSASEVFHLRSECARLAEKMLENNVVGTALTQSQVSHYNPQTNRCYVELSVQTANLSHLEYSSDTLYDGQTGELLAVHLVEGKTCPDGPDCKTTGTVYDEHHRMAVGSTPSQDAEDYIDALMDDDRER